MRREKPKTLVALVAACSFLVCLASQTLASAATTPPVTEHLIRDLGAPSFQTRETAARKLIEIGLPAKSTLIRAMRDHDLEVRMGAHRVLIQLLQNDFDSSIEQFLRDGHVVDSANFPGWELFRNQVGDAPPARQLYVQMLRAEPELLSALRSNDEMLSELVLRRIRSLTDTGVMVNGLRRPIAKSAQATLLFVCRQLADRADSPIRKNRTEQLAGRFSRLLLHAHPTEPVAVPGVKPGPVRQLLVDWINSIGQPDQRCCAYAMQLVLKYGLSEPGLELARDVLRLPTSSHNSKPYAAIVIARFGNRKDAVELARHLADTTMFHTWSNLQLKKEPIRIEVRDVVLAMLITLEGHDPHDFGFELLEDDPNTLYRIWTFGFLDESKRDRAFKDWERWCARQSQRATSDAGQ